MQETPKSVRADILEFLFTTEELALLKFYRRELALIQRNWRTAPTTGVHPSIRREITLEHLLEANQPSNARREKPRFWKCMTREVRTISLEELSY